ncbi:thermonuclease family protein [Ollibium composti]|uniref:thermonuclease family protein n=1 Tax=Ollibium composti TaxID=2675109 RepID=UPI001E62DA39|nr:thermonuclease family protein [Mesorhizobium composti]
MNWSPFERVPKGHVQLALPGYAPDNQGYRSTDGQGRQFPTAEVRQGRGYHHDPCRHGCRRSSRVFRSGFPGQTAAAECCAACGHGRRGNDRRPRVGHRRHGERIRFDGIDAPESAQFCADAAGRMYRCGARAAEALAGWLAAASPTTCKFVERDLYGRFVGNCTRADGANVQRWLVRSGHAMDWPRYSNGAFFRGAVCRPGGKDRHLARSVRTAVGVAGGPA